MGKVSALNNYAGYSKKIANGYQRSSVYVAVDDGCRIAVDILFPALNGELLEGPRPTVMLATGYRRAYRKSATAFNAPKYAKQTAHLPVGAIITAYEQRPVFREAIDHGYNVVCMDVRGTGASFGAHAQGHWRNGADVAQIVDWVAVQPWATDKVGMVGGSWEGAIQLYAAAYQPKHLTCIVPQIPPSFANALMINGLAPVGFAREWSAVRRGQDNQEPAVPVDGPDGERLFAEAQAARAPRYHAPVDISADPNARTTDILIQEYVEDAPPTAFPELGPLRDLCDEFEHVNRSGVAVYLQTGWWDMTYPGETLDYFSALTVPKRLMVGPWNHGVLPVTEPMRWFDYWLKGIDNGIMAEPPIAYSTSDETGDSVWKGVDNWPPAEVERREYFLSSRSSNTIASAYDGSLETARDGRKEYARYPVNYDVSLGECYRMRFMFRDEYIRMPDMAKRGEGCATFTSEPLQEELIITGSPEIHVPLSVTTQNGALIATLEQVGHDSKVTYLTEGWLNLEHRKIGDCPRPHAGAAWHSQLRKDMLPVEPGEVMQIGLELFPISVRIPVGARLRLTLAGADKDNISAAVHDPAPVMTFSLADARLVLPVEAGPVPLLEEAFAGQDPGFAFARD